MSVDIREQTATMHRAGRTGIALAALVAFQAMILIDDMIISIALPGMRADLALTPVQLSWAVNAYLLPFGGLLLLGGRAGDILGRRRMFLAGVTLFTVTSLVRGLATGFGMLVTARAFQGIGAALAMPCVLALIISMYPEGRLRKRAIAVYTAVGGLGAAGGLLLAGTITSVSSWRWVLMLNVPIGLVILMLTPLVIPETERRPGRFDLPGALTSTLGVAALVYALSNVGEQSWRSLSVQCAFGGGLVMLVVFAVIERTARQPIVVPRLFADRNRRCAYLVVLVVQGAQISQLFFLTQYLQQVLGFSPLAAALAFMPVPVALLAFAGPAAKLEPVIGARPLILAGAAALILSNLLLSRLGVSTSYSSGVLPGLLLLGTGIALATIPATIVATSGVEATEYGSASSIVNTLTTLGASLGLALLVTVMTGVSTRAAAGTLEASVQAHAFLEGMSAAFVTASAFGFAAMVVSLFLRSHRISRTG